MSHAADRSAFLRWTDPNTAPVVENNLVKLRPVGDYADNLGLFAVRDIPRGTRIIEEAPMIVLQQTQSIDNELEAFCFAFEHLTEAERSTFDQLHFNRDAIKILKVLTAARRWRSHFLTNDLNGCWINGSRSTEVIDIIYDRFIIFLSNCVFPGVGEASGKGLFALFSRINHFCVPNAFWVFNTTIERLTVHAIRHIRAGEQITISYIKDPIATKQVRTSMLAKWEFLCSCFACRDPVMEARIRRILELKRLLASYDATNEVSAGSSVPIPPIMEALPTAMELVALLENQGVAGMELANAYNYCALHSRRIGAERAARNYDALHDLTKRCAIGLDRLQGDGNVTEDAFSQLEHEFSLWEQQPKVEPRSPM